MSWDPNKLSLCRAAVAALLAVTAVSAAANVLVVRSSGPSARTYPPGRSLPDNARIALSAGDMLIVLDSRGTRTFRGPGTFSPATTAQSGQQTVTTPSGRRARIGAVRSAGILPTTPTTIWQVDASQGGTICLADLTNVTLWRPESSLPGTLIVSGPGGRSSTVQFPAGSATASWPADQPISDGAQYQLRTPGVAVPSQVTIKAVQTHPADLQGVAQALIDNGCREQLDLLVETAPTE